VYPAVSSGNASVRPIKVAVEKDFLTVQAVFFLGILGVIFYYGLPLGRNIKGIILGYGLCWGQPNDPDTALLHWVFLQFHMDCRPAFLLPAFVVYLADGPVEL